MTANSVIRNEEGRPPLTLVPAPDSEASPDTQGEVPIGTSDASPIDEETPTRVTRPWARASLHLRAALTDGDRWRRLWARLKRWAASIATLPDAFTKDQPSLRKCFNYALWGEQHPPSGVGRVFSVVTHVLLLPFVVAGRLYEWTFRRTLRAVAVCALIYVLAHVPAVRAVFVVTGRILTWPFTLGL